MYSWRRKVIFSLLGNYILESSNYLITFELSREKQMKNENLLFKAKEQLMKKERNREIGEGRQKNENKKEKRGGKEGLDNRKKERKEIYEFIESVYII